MQVIEQHIDNPVVCHPVQSKAGTVAAAILKSTLAASCVRVLWSYKLLSLFFGQLGFIDSLLQVTIKKEVRYF